MDVKIPEIELPQDVFDVVRVETALAARRDPNVSYTTNGEELFFSMVLFVRAKDNTEDTP
jgi:hypothetical protein